MKQSINNTNDKNNNYYLQQLNKRIKTNNINQDINK